MRYRDLASWVRNRRRSANELREACRELKLETTGNAAELRERLGQHIAAQDQDADAPWSPQQPVAPQPRGTRRWLVGIYVILLLIAGGVVWEVLRGSRAPESLAELPTIQAELEALKAQVAVPPATPAIATPKSITVTPILLTAAKAQANAEATAVTVPTIVPNVGTAPTLFDAQSTGKEYQASYDIGVKPDQLGVVFGYAISWSGKSSGGNGCGLVWLKPGWYPKFTITDGRYEIYDLPSVDREGWIRILVEQRAAEQAANYKCSSKKFEDVPVWESSLPSPPAMPTATAVPPTATPVVMVTPTATVTQPTATPVRERRATSQDQTLRFQTGEAVYGWKIELDDGQKCDGGECYLPSAPVAGSVTSGVINPWDSEVPAKVKANPWKP